MFTCIQKNKPYQYFSDDIAIILTTSYFRYLGHIWPLPSKTIMPTCRNFDVYLHGKNQLHLKLLFWDIVNPLQTCYFWNFGNASPSPSKIIMSISRKLSCLSACKKSVSSLTSLILQRKGKLVTLGNLGMYGHTHLKW